MRIVVILLVFANLTFLAYTRLDATSEGGAVRLAEQVQPDKIRLLTPTQVAALGPAKVAALPDVCLEWGPIGEADRAKALADLEPLGLGKLLTQKRLETNMAFWVFVPAAPNRAEADRRAAALKAQGVAEAAVVVSGPARLAIALGAFRDEEAARARLAELAAQGVATARVGPRQQLVVQTTFVIRDPPASVVARIRDLVGNYAGTESKVGGCEKG
jgi:hypothetical protein